MKMMPTKKRANKKKTRDLGNDNVYKHVNIIINLQTR